MDFKALARDEAIHTLSRAGLWPEGVPESLDLAVLGLRPEDLDRKERERLEAEREELRRRSRESRRLELYRQILEERNDEGAHARDEALRRALAGCRGELAGHAAEAVDLRYVQGLSFDAVAQKLDRTVAAARQLLQRVRLQLRECVEKKLAMEA